jgi:ATP-binding cassette subfamily B protein
MWLVRLYARVLGQLGTDMRLGAVLALANVGLAIAAFAEPVLFGRIIDVLTRSQNPANPPVTFPALMPLILAWVGFGLFSIGAGVLVALNADRLSHRRRLATMANYFEHVLELPLAFHTATHSGRVLKVMLEGTNGMAWLWLGFFREHFAGPRRPVHPLPLTVFLNWRLGLCSLPSWWFFTILTAIVPAQDRDPAGRGRELPFEPRRTRLRRARQRAGDPVLHPHRGETRALHGIIHQLLRPRTRCLSWWALASVAPAPRPPSR